MDDLKGRLIESATYGYIPHKDRKALTEAAARIAALEAEVARLTSLIAMDTLLQIDGELYDQPAGE